MKEREKKGKIKLQMAIQIPETQQVKARITKPCQPMAKGAGLDHEELRPFTKWILLKTSQIQNFRLPIAN